MERDRGFRLVAIVAICLSIIGLAIGYSALQATLNINTKTTLKGSSWSISAKNFSNAVITGSAEQVNVPSAVSSEVNFDVLLKKPGDSISYTFDIINEGTIDAKLSAAPTLTGVDEAKTSNNITYTLTYANGSQISQNDELLSGEANKKSFKMTVTFDSDASAVVSEDTVLNLKATLLYVQQ